MIDLSQVDPETLRNAPKKDLIALAKNLAELQARAGQVGPQNDDELHALIKRNYGVHIPRVAVTPGHDAPFTFVADAFFQRETSQFVIANREGAKTYSVAIIHALMARFYPGYEGITAGAIEIQAKRCYGSLKQLNNKWGGDMVKDSLISETLWSNNSKVEIVTGCLPPYAKIITDQGEMKISTIVNKKLPVNVKSYNFDTQQWEWKPVTGWHNNGKTEKWLRVKLRIGRQGKTHLCATSGHSVYLPDGSKKLLGEFAPGEVMCVPGSVLSAQQEQILAGKLLGDGHINAKGITCFDHSNDQVGYLRWLYSAFSEFASGYGERTAKHTTSFRLRAARRFHEARHEWYPDGVKRIPPSVWSQLDSLGLAVWMMDDGSWTPSSGGQWVVSCHHFNAAERFGMSMFFDTLGVDGSWVEVDREKDQWIWRTTGTGGIVLLAIVSSYIDVSQKQRKGYKQWISQDVIESSSEGLLAAEIETITEHFVTDKSNQTRYDITVADNHNYCVGSGILISNTYAAMNGPHSNLLHRDEVELFRRNAFNEGDNITKSGTLADGRTIKAHDVLTSTRKKARGLVQEILDQCDEAVAAGIRPPYRVYKWGVAETVKRVPNCRGLPENADKPDAELCPCNRIINGFWDSEGKNPRSLEAVCAGRFGRSDGWRPLDPDIISKFTKNSRAMWEAQQECMKVASEGLILPDFSKELYGIRNYDPDPENGKFYMSVDFGGTNPHAVNWYQLLSRDVEVDGYAEGERKTLRSGTLVCFGEIYITEIGNVALAELAVKREIAYKLKHTFFQVEARIGDIAAKAARLDWAQHRPKLELKWGITRDVDDHILLCQEIIADHRFAVDVGSCPMFCEEAEAWQRDPETQKQVDEFNHAMSAFRYIVAYLHRRMMVHKKTAGGPVPAATAAGATQPISRQQDFSRYPEAGPSRSLNEDPYGIPMHQGPASGRPDSMY